MANLFPSLRLEFPPPFLSLSYSSLSPPLSLHFVSQILSYLSLYFMFFVSHFMYHAFVRIFSSLTGLQKLAP